MRKTSGWVLYEVAVSLMLVALGAEHVVRSSGIHVAMHKQSAATAAAARLGTELSEWAQRRGLHVLGLPVDGLLAARLSPTPACHDGGCDAVQGARYFLAQWQARLWQAIPQARAEICIDRLPARSGVDWPCAQDGTVAVLKLGWPSARSATVFRPAMAVALGPAP
jgi:hypothetical protein